MPLSDLWIQNFSASIAQAGRELTALHNHLMSTTALSSDVVADYTSHADKHGAIDAAHTDRVAEWIDYTP